MKPYPLIVKDLVSGLTKQQIKVFIHEQVKKILRASWGQILLHILSNTL